MPLTDATVPATGARRIVSSSFFCADATCCCADVTAASACASCSGFGACCFTATLATGGVVLLLRRRELRLRVLDALPVLELAARLVLLGARQPLLRGRLLALRLRQTGLRGVDVLRERQQVLDLRAVDAVARLLRRIAGVPRAARLVEPVAMSAATRSSRCSSGSGRPCSARAAARGSPGSDSICAVETPALALVNEDCAWSIACWYFIAFAPASAGAA